MDRFATSHFSDSALLQDLKRRAADDNTSTAVLLSRIAEVDDRKLYLREGYPSMFGLCAAPHSANYAEIRTMRR